MTQSLFNILKAGPPPPKVVLLPDEMFFTRAVSVAPNSSAADVSAQVELALETLSPFPPAQLYHGYFWTPGAERALIFAAYRRRFSSEQVAEWDNAELVLPTFAALLGGDAKADTAVIIPSETGLTALYYDAGPIPAKVSFVSLPAEATDADRTRAHDELVAAAPNSRPVLLGAAPSVLASRNEGEFSFKAEAYASRLPTSQAAAIDVRDKAELAAHRRSRRRDLVLWRTFVGVCLALVVLGLGELTLIGARIWDKTLQAKANTQQPVVEKIETAQTLTNKINELSTKRLLPIEMIEFVNGSRPGVIRFLRTSTEGIYGLTVEAISTAPAAVPEYRAKLAALPELEKVEFTRQQARDNGLTFTMLLTFRPGALKPEAVTP
jgi:hypothetical protein